jgi:hypothetical protein
MSTQHLSVSVTLYPDGEWAIALLKTSTRRGRPAVCEQLITRKTDLEGVRRDVDRALEKMVLFERTRLALEGRPGEHP